MSIKTIIGGNEITGMFFGDNLIQKLYKGDEIVFEKLTGEELAEDSNNLKEYDNKEEI